jgi:hypothetical protein
MPLSYCDICLHSTWPGCRIRIRRKGQRNDARTWTFSRFESRWTIPVSTACINNHHQARLTFPIHEPPHPPRLFCFTLNSGLRCTESIRRQPSSHSLSHMRWRAKLPPPKKNKVSTFNLIARCIRAVASNSTFAKNGPKTRHESRPIM